MADIYKQNIIDHYNSPRNYSKLEVYTHKAKFSNTLCGDEVEVYLNISKGVITNASFIGSGCALSIATASILIEQIVNKPIKEVLELKYDDLLNLIGIKPSPSRSKCVLSSLEAIRSALKS